MELIKKLPTKVIKGRYVSFAEFLCEIPQCGKIVIRRLSNGLRAKSCGCVRYILIAEANKGKKRTDRQRQKISETRIKNGIAKGENNPMYGKKGENSPSFGKIRTEEFRQNLRGINIGKKVSEETRQKQVKSAKERFKNPKNHPMFGKKRTEKSKQKQAQSRKGKYCGEDSPHWQGGKSFEEYPQEFKQIKSFILERDNYTCQNPCCKHLSSKLAVHHIDYDKKNNNSENLITLCNSCHTKTNGKNNRNYWTNYYQNIVINIL